MNPLTPTADDRELPPLAVIDAIDKWVHYQTRFHLPDTDGYREMLTDVARAIQQYADRKVLSELASIDVKVERDDDDVVLDMKAHRVMTHLKKRIEELTPKKAIN